MNLKTSPSKFSELFRDKNYPYICRYKKRCCATFVHWSTDLEGFKIILKHELDAMYTSYAFVAILEYTLKGYPHYHGVLYTNTKVLKKPWTDTTISAKFYTISKAGYTKRRVKNKWIQGRVDEWYFYCVKHLGMSHNMASNSYMIEWEVKTKTKIETYESIIDKAISSLDITLKYGFQTETKNQKKVQEKTPKASQEELKDNPRQGGEGSTTQASTLMETIDLGFSTKSSGKFQVY